jgi:two-component sensor histidine kinase
VKPSAHDLLWQSSAVGVIDVGRFIADVCERMQPQAPSISLDCQVDSITIGADLAIAAGLLVTELVTNAVKYAYPGGGGRVAVSCRGTPARYVIRVADTGVGLPADFDFDAARPESLGMRMVRSLATQLKGRLTLETDGGTAFALTIDGTA